LCSVCKGFGELAQDGEGSRSGVLELGKDPVGDPVGSAGVLASQLEAVIKKGDNQLRTRN